MGRGNALAAGAGIDALSGDAQRSDFELAARAGACVGVSNRAQSRQRFRIEWRAIRLAGDAAVPREAVAFKRGENLPFGAFAGARRIDVLDAQQPLAAHSARVAVAGQRRDERTEVQRTGRRGREAAAIARPAFRYARNH